MNACATPRSRAKDEIDIVSCGIELQRSTRSLQTFQQNMETKLDSIVKVLSSIMESQRDASLDINSALFKHLAPLESAIKSLADQHHQQRLLRESSDDRNDEAYSSFKEHLERTHGMHTRMEAQLSGLQEFVSKSSQACDVAEVKENNQGKLAGPPPFVPEGPLVNPSGLSTEELQFHLRAELLGFEKAVKSHLDEQLVLITQTLDNAKVSSEHLERVDKHRPDRAQVHDASPSNAISKHNDWNPRLASNMMPEDRPQPAPPPLNPPGILVASCAPVSSPTPKRKLSATLHGEQHDLQGVRQSNAISTIFYSDTKMEAKTYHVEDYYKEEGVFQALARDHRFENLTSFIVVLNAIYIGIDTDRNNADNLYQSDAFFQISSQFFAIYFTGELVIRFLAFRKTSDAFRDGWFRFDTILVAFFLLETYILMPVLLIASGDGIKLPTQPLRILRLAKILRMSRLMRAFPELVTMMLGLARSLRAIFSTLVLLILMMYVWGILLHGLLKDEDGVNKFLQSRYEFEFSTMGHCLWTLLIDGVLQLDNAALVMTALIYNSDWKVLVAGVAFTAFSLLSSLLILQMLIGVMCDVVAQVGAEQRKAKAILVVKQELAAELNKRDDGYGHVSKADFKECMSSESSTAVFRHLRINPHFFLELASLFYEDSDKPAPTKALLELVMLCRGDNIVTVDLLAIVLCFLNNELADMEGRMVGHITNLSHQHDTALTGLRGAATTTMV